MTKTYYTYVFSDSNLTDFPSDLLDSGKAHLTANGILKVLPPANKILDPRLKLLVILSKLSPTPSNGRIGRKNMSLTDF